MVCGSLQKTNILEGSRYQQTALTELMKSVHIYNMCKDDHLFYLVLCIYLKLIKHLLENVTTTEALLCPNLAPSTKD